MDKFLKPLRIFHNFYYHSVGGSCAPLSEKKKVVESFLDELDSCGYGGFVTNINLDNYLCDPDNDALFVHCIEYADKLNMRVWIYDEHGYPSGAAGGLTLKENPDYEARGLTCTSKKAACAEHVTIELPYGCEELVCAYAVDASAKRIDLSSFVSDKDCLNWVATCDCHVYYMASKRSYEHTHAAHNVHTARRYVNLLDNNAVCAFINNTYKKYYNLVGKYFGNTIQAFFTDEPSLMSAYINTALVPPNVTDTIDEKVPMLPVCNWDKSVLVEYQKRYGEDLRFNLHFLFGGDSDEARNVRYKYNEMISDMFEYSYFKQIGDYCKSVGVHFSGHVLLEESLLHHSIFEGNIFRFMTHMGVPGIDMLTTIPRNILNQATTIKVVASSGAWYGKEHVMSESSGHVEGAYNIKYGPEEILGSIFTQFALGVDTITSYYNHSIYSKEENSVFCDASGRLCEFFKDGKSTTDILLYYPIDSMWSENIGSDKDLGQRQYTPAAHATNSSWESLVKQLILSDFQYDCIDFKALLEADVHDGFIVNPRTGHTYCVLVLPKVVSLTHEVLCKLETLAKQGVKIIFENLSADNLFVPGSSSDCKQLIDSIIALPSVTNSSQPEYTVTLLNSLAVRHVLFEENNPGILSLHKKDTASGFDSLYFLANLDNENKHINASFAVDCACGKLHVTVCDVKSGDKYILDCVAANGRCNVPVDIEGYSGLIIGFSNGGAC